MLLLEEITLDLAGYQSRALVRQASRSGAPVLLFLHGWSDSADTYRPLMTLLADLDATLVSLDLPGFGAASDLHPGKQLPQFVAFARAALDLYGNQGPVLPIGQSLGARALLMAMADPEAPKIPALMAIAPAPLELPGWQKVLVRNASLAPSASNLGDVLSFEQRVQALVTSFKRTCFLAPDDLPAEVFERYASHYTPARAERHIETLRLLGDEFQQPLDLGGVESVVELVWGQQDRMAPIIGAQRYLEALPQVRLTTLDHCAHHAHLEKSAEIAQLIRGMFAAQFGSER